jgi:predicted acetyltransferase
VLQPEVTVRAVAPSDFAVLERLWLMFHHDLSEFRGRLPEPDGTFHNERLRAAVDDPAWATYLFWKQDRPVGLAMVRALDQPVQVLSAFFTVRGLRRTGLGSHAVREVLVRHPGSWEIPFQHDNEPAVHFWRRTAIATAGERWTEERRAVPARPDLPPDVWISFATEDPTLS